MAIEKDSLKMITCEKNKKMKKNAHFFPIFGIIGV